MVKLELVCKSCGQRMNFDKKDYEKHIQNNHKSKINRKEQYFNVWIIRINEN